jgi:CcmD family protein
MNAYYLIAGYLVLWLFIFAYLLILGLKFRALNRKVSQLENMLTRRNGN